MIDRENFLPRHGSAPARAGIRAANVLVHLAAPVVGNEVQDVVNDLASVAGVARVRPGAKLPVVLIDYDPAVVGTQSLIAHVRRRFAAAQLVAM
jgi:hypothetical protein